MALVSIPEHVKEARSIPNDVNLLKELTSRLEGKILLEVKCGASMHNLGIRCLKTSFLILSMGFIP